MESISPVYITELVLSLTTLQSNGDIKCSTRRDGAAYPRHGNDGDVVERNVTGGLGNEHETFIETEEETFVCFDRAFDS